MWTNAVEHMVQHRPSNTIQLVQGNQETLEGSSASGSSLGKRKQAAEWYQTAGHHASLVVRAAGTEPGAVQGRSGITICILRAFGPAPFCELCLTETWSNFYVHEGKAVGCNVL